MKLKLGTFTSFLSFDYYVLKYNSKMHLQYQLHQPSRATYVIRHQLAHMSSLWQSSPNVQFSALSSNRIRRVKFCLCLLFQLAAEKKTSFLVQLKQIFGPSYFVWAYSVDSIKHTVLLNVLSLLSVLFSTVISKNLY